MFIKETVGDMVLSPKTKIVVNIVDTGVKNKEHTDKIDIRVYFQNFEGSWLPTKKGVSFYKKELLGKLITLLQKADTK